MNGSLVLLVFPDGAQDLHAQLPFMLGPVCAGTKPAFPFACKTTKSPKAEKTHPVLPQKRPI